MHDIQGSSRWVTGRNPVANHLLPNPLLPFLLASHSGTTSVQLEQPMATSVLVQSHTQGSGPLVA
jgi:hypothetical protein